MTSFFFRLLFCSAMSYVAWKIGAILDEKYAPIGLLITSPLWGHLFARDLLAILPAIKYWAEYAALNKWQGKYYVFDGYHLRFYLVDDVVWVPLKDVSELIQPGVAERELRLLGADYATIPEHTMPGITESGLLKLLTARTEHRRADHQMIRLKLWLVSSALPNVKRLPVSRANAR